MKEKLLGSNREGLGIGLRLGIRIADLNLTPCLWKSIGAVTDLDRPPTPFNVTVRPYRNSLHISWSVPASDHPADYHIVEYRTVGQWVPLTDRVAGGNNQFNWTTASRGATYHFRVIGFYDRPADSESTGSDEAPAPDEEEDDEQSAAPWLQSIPSDVVTIVTGGECTVIGWLFIIIIYLLKV